jgi:hypothetical protein
MIRHGAAPICVKCGSVGLKKFRSGWRNCGLNFSRAPGSQYAWYVDKLLPLRLLHGSNPHHGNEAGRRKSHKQPRRVIGNRRLRNQDSNIGTNMLVSYESMEK